MTHQARILRTSKMRVRLRKRQGFLSGPELHARQNTDHAHRIHTFSLRAAHYNDIFVGVICSQVQPATDDAPKRLYISALAVLAAYRGRGVGE